MGNIKIKHYWYNSFIIQNDKVKIASIPVWLMRLIISVTKIFNKQQGEMLAFLTTAMTSEVVAPATGTRTLWEHYGTFLENR